MGAVVIESRLPARQSLTQASIAAMAARPDAADKAPHSTLSFRLSVSRITGLSKLSGPEWSSLYVGKAAFRPSAFACLRSSAAAPMITGEQTARTSPSATALSTISGPMPAGSPIVIPTRGLSGLLGARVTRVHCHEEGIERGNSSRQPTLLALPPYDHQYGPRYRRCRLRHPRFCTCT